MNNITILNTTFGTIRTLYYANSEWFVGVDICKILGLQNVTLCIKKIDESEKKKCVIQGKVMNIISKVGVCQLCQEWSRQPKSKALEQWIRENFTMNKEKNLPVKVNESVEKTPIEAALGVDESGHVTAKKLYEWLMLNPSNYSSWVKRHILENPFAETPKDYSYLTTSEKNVGKGNYAPDYLLSASFAKKLAMMTKSARGEQAREYFIKVEEELANNVKETKIAEIRPVSDDAMMVFARAMEQMVQMQKDMNDKFSQMMDMVVKQPVATPGPVVLPVHEAPDTPTKEKPALKKSAYDNIMDVRRYPVTATVISRDYGLDVRAFNVMLSMQGIIQKKEDHWEPTKEFKESGIM